MNNDHIKEQLEDFFKKMEGKGPGGDTGYTANETQQIAVNSMQLIRQFKTEDEGIEEARKEANELLAIAVEKATEYYEKEHGYDIGRNTNTKVRITDFTNPTYNALELFLSVV